MDTRPRSAVGMAPRLLTLCSVLLSEGAIAPAARLSRCHGPWITSHPFVPSLAKDSLRFLIATILIALSSQLSWATGNLESESLQNTASTTAPSCKPVYLTLDTGHMEVAPLIAGVLNKHQIKVTFFAANERTKAGDGSLGDYWGPWWKARAGEGHEFASHTFNHSYWRGDVKGQPETFRIRPSAGPEAGRDLIWTSQRYCEDITKSNTRLQALTGKVPLPLFRAPGGKTSPALLAAARGCGFAHAGWSDAGFLGDELSSEQFPNDVLLKKALASIRSGDVLLAHLGIWSRKDPWAPANLEPLISGLQARGFCFRTLREHPLYKSWIDGHTGGALTAPAK